MERIVFRQSTPRKRLARQPQPGKIIRPCVRHPIDKQFQFLLDQRHAFSQRRIACIGSSRYMFPIVFSIQVAQIIAVFVQYFHIIVDIIRQGELQIYHLPERHRI